MKLVIGETKKINLDYVYEKLLGIMIEYCPATDETLEAEAEQGYNHLCGCSICDLLKDINLELTFRAMEGIEE